MTLEDRIRQVLGTVSPLRSEQVVRALHPTKFTTVHTTLSRLTRQERLERVPSAFPPQDNAPLNAYALRSHP